MSILLSILTRFQHISIPNYNPYCDTYYIHIIFKMSPPYTFAVPEDLLTEWDLPELMECLASVADWFTLGIFLRIPHSQLEIIESGCLVASSARRIRRLLSDMLAEWIQNHQEEAKWSNLVYALSAIGKRAVARKIAHEYGT